MRIALDDERNFSRNQIDILFRSPGLMLLFLQYTTRDVEVLYLDNDLGEDILEGRYVLRELFQEKIYPKRICLTTANPVARNAIEKDLLDVGYKRFNEQVWDRK